MKGSSQELLAIDLSTTAKVLLFGLGRQPVLKSQLLVPFSMDFSEQGITMFAQSLREYCNQLQSKCDTVVITGIDLPTVALGKSSIAAKDVKQALKSVEVKNRNSQSLEDIKVYRGKTPTVLSTTVSTEVVSSIVAGFATAGFSVRGLFEFQSCLASGIATFYPKTSGIAVAVLDSTAVAYASVNGAPRGKKALNSDFVKVAEVCCAKCGINYEQFVYLMQTVGTFNDESVYAGLTQFGVDPTVWFNEVIPEYLKYLDVIAGLLGERLNKDKNARYLVAGMLTSFQGTLEFLKEKLPTDQILVPMFEQSVGVPGVANASGNYLMPEMFFALCAAFASSEVFDLTRVFAQSKGQKYTLLTLPGSKSTGSSGSGGSGGRATETAAGSVDLDSGNSGVSGGFVSDGSGVSSSGAAGGQEVLGEPGAPSEPSTGSFEEGLPTAEELAAMSPKERKVAQKKIQEAKKKQQAAEKAEKARLAKEAAQAKRSQVKAAKSKGGAVGEEVAQPEGDSAGGPDASADKKSKGGFFGGGKSKKSKQQASTAGAADSGVSGGVGSSGAPGMASGGQPFVGSLIIPDTGEVVEFAVDVASGQVYDIRRNSLLHPALVQTALGIAASAGVIIGAASAVEGAGLAGAAGQVGQTDQAAEPKPTGKKSKAQKQTATKAKKPKPEKKSKGSSGRKSSEMPKGVEYTGRELQVTSEFDVKSALQKLPSVQSQLIDAPPEIVALVTSGQMDERTPSRLIELVMQAAVERMASSVNTFYNLVLLCGAVLCCAGAIAYGSTALTKAKTGDPMTEIKELTEQRAAIVQQVEAKENYFRTKNDAFEKYVPYMEYMYSIDSNSVVIEDFNLVGDTLLMINASVRSMGDFSKLLQDFTNMVPGAKVLENSGHQILRLAGYLASLT